MTRIIPLSEAYRPKTFADVVGMHKIDTLVNLVKEPKTLPNLLFYGPQGTGKTSVAKIIIEQLSPINVLKINGSDKTGVENIRTNVYNFVSSMTSVPDKPKIVFIDEFDGLSPEAFGNLRGMIEGFIKNARYICTVNYIHKIPEPIQSRFTLFEFVKPKDEEIYGRVRNICDMEGISVTDNTLLDIVKNNRGDIRATINTIQKLACNQNNAISDIDFKIIKPLVQEVFKLLNEKEWSKLRYDIPNKHPDYNNLLVDLEDLFFKSGVEVSKKSKINEIIADGLYQMVFSFDKNITFSAICSRIIKEI